MNIWKILGIDKTTEKSDIKKAYRQKLKITRPDEDEAAFIKLRNAYENALEYAENNYTEFEDFDDYDMEYEEDCDKEYEEDCDNEYEDEYEEEYYYEPDEYDRWNISLIELWGDLKKKYDPECWRSLLYEGAPYKLKYYEISRERIKELVFNSRSWVFLPVDVYRVIDDFFSFSTGDESCIHMQNAGYQRWVNEITRISARVDVNKLHPNVNPDTVDGLLYRYKEAVEVMVSRNEINNFEELDLKYLPLETLKISLSFDKYSDKEFADAVEILKKEYGADVETELLTAERMIYKGEDATELLEKLYQRLPKTDIAFTYRLMNCCKLAGLYYEGYMLAKHSLWMFCTRRMNQIADEFSNLIENEYKGLSDTEHIRMCRMYLRSNREKEAISILEKVRDTNTWEYHMARALAYFNETDITPGVESYEILKAFSKENLHFIQKLEWEELQGRYYLEKKEYIKCINKCNELLRRYPESYPIKILRSYADRLQYGEYGNYECMCDFWRMYERPEVTLFVAKIYCDNHNWEDAVYILKNLKNKCDLQYRYCQVRNLINEDYNKYKAEWMKLLDFMASKDFYINVKSKYGLLDFEEIFSNSSSPHYVDDEKKEYKNALTKIVNSSCNNLGKGVNKYLYYNLVFDYQNALKEAKNNFNNAKYEEERIDAMVALCESYAFAGQYDEMDREVRRFEKKYPEYEEGLNRIYSRVVTLYRYEYESEKTLYYGLKCKDYISIYTIDVCIDMIQAYYLLGHIDTNNYQKAIDIANEFFSIYGKYKVNGVNDSPYRCLAFSYAALGQVDKAMAALDFMCQNSNTDYYKYRYNDYAFDVYMEAHQPEKAYEYLLKAEENGEYIQRFSKIKIYMILGRYEEAFRILDDMAANDNDPDADLIMCAMHSKYFMDDNVDMEYLLKAKNEVERKLSMPDGAIGDNYFHMAQVYMLLDNEEEALKYYEMGMNYSEWKDPTSKVISQQLIALWTYWYRKDYDRAYNYCKKNVIINFHYELSYLEYMLCEMFERGETHDTGN